MTNKLMTLVCLSACLLFNSIASANDSIPVEDALAIPRTNFAVADADEDAVLNTAEFVVFIDANAESKFGNAAKIRRFGAYKRAFKKIDADKSGGISWEELAQAQ